jgi:hypothetical protein
MFYKTKLFLPKILTLTFLCFLCNYFQIFQIPNTYAQEAPKSLIISEVFFSKAPKFLDKCNRDFEEKSIQNLDNLCSYDKWIEIQNISQKSINLNGYFLQIGKLPQAIKITENLVIPSQGYGIIANKRQNLISVLDRLNIQNKIKIGFLQNISNNNEEENYLKVGLYEDRALTKLISKIELQTLPIFNQNTFSSLEFCGVDMVMQKPKNVSFKLENYSFYGSPNGKQICPKEIEKTPDKVIQVAPVKDQKPQLIPQQQANLSPEVNLQLKPQPSLQAQLQTQPQKVYQKEIELNAQTQPKIVSQTIPQKALTKYNSINNINVQNLETNLNPKLEIETNLSAISNPKIIQKTNLNNNLAAGSQNLDLVSNAVFPKRFLDNSVIGVSSDVFNILLSTLFLTLIIKKAVKKINSGIFKVYRLLFQFRNIKIVTHF